MVIIIFFDIKGIVHKEFVPTGQRVNGKLYCDVLRRLRENNRRKRPDKWRNNSWVLHHDSAPAHASLVVRQFLASTNTTVIPLPPYSPDLSLCDFFSIPEDKIDAQRATF
jgi:histone-lysine N-methyltransferase SETMAR